MVRSDELVLGKHRLSSRQDKAKLGIEMLVAVRQSLRQHRNLCKHCFFEVHSWVLNGALQRIADALFEGILLAEGSRVG